MQGVERKSRPQTRKTLVKRVGIFNHRPTSARFPEISLVLTLPVTIHHLCSRLPLWLQLSTMELKTIAVLGPGGNVGSAIISQLLKAGPAFTITAITRQTSPSYTAPEGSNITHKTVDYDSFDSLVNVFTGQDAVVNCVTGRATQYDPSKLIIDAAVAAGVKFFFANEFVSNMDTDQFQRLPESHAGAKLRIREYLGQLASDGEIAWTGLNGGPFFDMWVAKGPAGFDIANRCARIYCTGENNLCWTPVPTIALAAVNMLQKPDSVINRAIFICPFSELNQKMILKALEEVMGTTFTVENIDVKRINENARIALENGELAKAMKSLTISYQYYEGDTANELRHLVENDLVGVEIMNVEDAVRDTIAHYGKDVKVVEGMFRVEPCEI